MGTGRRSKRPSPTRTSPDRTRGQPAKEELVATAGAPSDPLNLGWETWEEGWVQGRAC